MIKEKNVLVETETAENESNKPNSNKPAETEQQSTAETANHKKPEGINGVTIALIILLVASILGGIVYYF